MRQVETGVIAALLSGDNKCRDNALGATTGQHRDSKKRARRFVTGLVSLCVRIVLAGQCTRLCNHRSSGGKIGDDQEVVIRIVVGQFAVK